MALFPVATTYTEGGKTYEATANVVVEYSNGATSWFVEQLIVWRSQVGGAVLDIHDGVTASSYARRKMSTADYRRMLERNFRACMGSAQYDEAIERAWLMAKPVGLNEEGERHEG